MSNQKNYNNLTTPPSNNFQGEFVYDEESYFLPEKLEHKANIKWVLHMTQRKMAPLHSRLQKVDWVEVITEPS